MGKRLEYNGKELKYNDNGSGKVIVLLHGYLEASQSWGQFAVKLANNYRVLAIDLPGHGLSETCGTIHTMEYMAKAVSFILDRLKIDHINLIGHSLGGYVALAFLELFPEKLDSICLFHSHPFPDGNETIEKRKREIQIVNAGKKNLMYPDNVTKMFADVNVIKFRTSLEYAKKIASCTPGDGIIAVLNGMMQRPSRTDLLEKGIVPFLWVLGRLDNYINCDAVTSKINLPDNAIVLILEESGHMGFIEEEDRSLKEVTRFIESISS
jgi:pimeloyl-ACP methyl ester carboxylesterase